MISIDLACAITEANIILSLVPQVKRPAIAEIGAGHGRLAYAISKAIKCRYVIFDIPPALHVSQWYLSQVLPEKRMFPFRRFDRFEDIADELAGSDIAFFTPNQMRLFPDDYFDIAASISTLPELTTEQVDLFLELMQRTSRSFIYLKQWYRWKNEKDGTDLTIDSYRFARNWRRIRTEVDPLIPWFFNAVWPKV
jgi:putative sugar O-methyltransferase